MSETLYTLMVIVGPLLLLAVLVFAMLRNRTSRAQYDRTEAATRQMHKEQNAEDRERDP